VSLTIDASVWIAAADATDKFHQSSRDFLRKVVADGIAVIQPAFGRTEVVCALARRLRDGVQAQQLTHSLMNRMVTSEIAMNTAFLTATENIGSCQFLRGADALYATVAQQSQSPLISWDNEHLQRAGGITPTDWLVANP
jgi:predicted nucleic acid-binding protein